MSTRASFAKLAPNSFNAMMQLDKSLAESPVEKTIRDLIKIRVSQLNGCIFCLDMHSKEAKIHGERELRLYHLPVWRESKLFSEKERAALGWAELLTHPPEHGADDTDYSEIAAHFSDKEIVDLTVAISAINAWNRLGIAFRNAPGSLDTVMGLDKANLK